MGDINHTQRRVPDNKYHFLQIGQILFLSKKEDKYEQWQIYNTQP